MNYQSLSKEISYALRHAPWEYELEMDEEGRVLVEQLLEALHREEKWKDVREADLHEIIRTSEKKRFEIKDGKIRAFYGHSIPMKIVKQEMMPPDILYHGTARRFLEPIQQSGLLPKSRQYVHMSQDVETAEAVGKRHDAKPCILAIDAKQAWEDGVKFYFGNEKVWLADAIPSKYIEQMKDIITRYRKNYIKEMRKDVGHAPLMATACGVIIENDKGEILLQKRRDNGCWGLPGGSMEIGEKLTEVAKREVFEEVGIEIRELTLFGIYSGEDRIVTYPNRDICCVTCIVFKTIGYSGDIQNNTEEALEHRFFGKTSLPDNINEFDKRYITDWTKNPRQVIVD